MYLKINSHIPSKIAGLPFSFLSCLALMLSLSACEPWNLESGNFPEVITLDAEASLARPTEVTLSGQIQGLLDNASVQDHGHVWSFSNREPGLEDHDGLTQLQRIGNGEFQSTATGLTPGRQVFYRAYAIFENNTFYGQALGITAGTLSLLAQPDSIIQISRIKEKSNVVFQSSLLNLPDQLTIKQYGTTWSTEQDPVPTQDFFTIDGLDLLNSDSRIVYQSVLPNVAPGTYYLRPYVQIGDTTYYGANYCIQLGDFWVQREPFPGEVCGGRSAFSIGGKGFFGFGEELRIGESTFRSCALWSYDPSSDKWTEGGGGLSPRNGARSFMVNNRLYVGFGYRNALGNEDFDPQYNDLSAYDPDTDSWERKASFPSERDGIIAFAVNNYIFAGGGTYRDFSEPSIDHQDFWKYDPVSDQWTQLKDLPQGHRKKGTGFGLLNKGYWINETEFWEYLPDSDEWKEKSYPLPSGQGLRYDFTINGKAYLRAGGTFWEYDPLGESWTERTNGPSGESFAIDDIGYRLSGQVWAYYPLIECE